MFYAPFRLSAICNHAGYYWIIDSHNIRPILMVTRLGLQHDFLTVKSGPKSIFRLFSPVFSTSHMQLVQFFESQHDFTVFALKAK